MKLFLITLFTLITLVITPLTFAAESSSSADLQSKINQIKAQIASKAAEIKKEVNQKIANKVFAGRVSTKEGSKITLSTSIPRVIITDDYTDISYEKGLTQAINKDNYIIGLGDMDDKGNLIAKKLLKVSPPRELTVISGRIKSSSESAIIIDKDQGNDLVIKISKDTDVLFGGKEGSIKDANPSRVLIVSGFENSDKTINARFIYIFKQGFIDLFKKTASNSASQSGKIAK
jgi:hypothetical protein